MKRSDENLAMLFDYYEMTMANGYFERGIHDTIGYFDLYYRKNPDDAGFAIFSGLESIIDYLKDFHFSDDDIAFFRSKKIYSDAFLAYLKDLHFTCDVWCVPDGSVVFPGEPLITVRGPMAQTSLIETMLLLLVNHQSLIATKASRIVRAAQGRPVMEFGSRRAQGPDAATLGARAAYIGGCVGTADTLSDQRFGVPALGTMAHSWVQLFPTEYEAFKTYAEIYPTNATLLVDTYDTLSSGVPNAIRVFDDVLKPKGIAGGIRLDSGDIAYLSKKARVMLDEAGHKDAKIVASNSLDEYRIEDILAQGAKIDSFGVGENLITSKSSPVFGGVYKLVGLENDGVFEPRIKISENVEKITTPGFKTFYRLYEKDTGKAIADVITMKNEKVDDSKPYEIFHPVYTWKRMRLEDYTAREMKVRIFDGGKCVYDLPSLNARRDYCAKELDTLWDEYKRFDNPHEYKVDLSLAVWDMKHDLLARTQQRIRP
ncbi:nicotinate phosphoribosyltransferase [Levyella massiliensis]|uniref:nicotinate phosphoribosyltransferase n=1 Tax=Levyella massiliensis TaxID=938289 RepID=UPI00036B4802|nr:nicotinate phosphoribosyltransferase [Levyella massiliensis]